MKPYFGFFLNKKLLYSIFKLIHIKYLRIQILSTELSSYCNMHFENRSIFSTFAV